MTARVISPRAARPTSPYFDLGASLARASAASEKALTDLVPTIPAPAPSAPPRELHVVEFFAEGQWLPLCGDAYIDAEEAAKVSDRSSLETRVVVYVPRGEP